jgi:hypothetical protein
MWRYTALTLKHLLTTGLSIVAVFTSGLASGLTREVLRGRNYSDVGVPMYENDGMARGAGFLVFLIVLLGFLYILQRTLSRNLQWLPYLVATITCICSAPILFFMLVW